MCIMIYSSSKVFPNHVRVTHSTLLLIDRTLQMFRKKISGSRHTPLRNDRRPRVKMRNNSQSLADACQVQE